MRTLFRLATDDRGAINTDFVALTAGVLLVGLVVVFAIYNLGVLSLVDTTNEVLETRLADIDTGTSGTLTQ